MTRDDLARFRSGYPSCELAALVDIAAGTVLLSDAAIPLGQEHLDHLCEQAGCFFGADLPIGARRAFLAGPPGTRLFLRAPAEADEALCFLIAPGTDLAELAGAAERLWSPGTGA